MNRTARETLIREWHERVADVEKQIDALKELTGLSPESPLHASVMLMAHAYTLTVEGVLARDNVCWLEWWWLECNLGSTPRAASPSNDTPLRVIATIDDLVLLVLGALESVDCDTPPPADEIPTIEQMREILNGHPRERALSEDAARGNFRAPK